MFRELDAQFYDVLGNNSGGISNYCMSLYDIIEWY